MVEPPQEDSFSDWPITGDRPLRTTNQDRRLTWGGAVTVVRPPGTAPVASALGRYRVQNGQSNWMTTVGSIRGGATRVQHRFGDAGLGPTYVNREGNTSNVFSVDGGRPA